ncbi:scarecrow-like protein 15 [Lactuca sativa]|uniref:Scarecrow-like protein 15 n=1 Tax=Lactuca sativa TaxID=4236 RepID=A0A9R1XNE2_LACSA|nr:scarecrow-like protein 15 [Lactuca sativa]KAJ0216049.1 hypothetical protein LSAT_V11C300131800 [Lactuca sativa]
MKLPFASQQNNLSSPEVKHQIISGGVGGGGTGRYEPKSVLDICRSLPGKTSEFDSGDHNSIVLSSSEDPLRLDNYEHGIVNQFEEWDSLMKELGLNDDSAKSAYLPELPDLPPIQSEVTAPTMSLFLNPDFENPNTNTNPNSLDFTNQYNIDNRTGFDFVDDIIRIAECFETQSLHLAQVILARLNQRLPSPNGKPLQRAAFYFKEAIQSLISGSTRLTQSSSSSEIVQTIKAYKTFITVSPIPMFSSFTANQAILEAVDGAMIIHVIDFDIGIGGHWASFMKEISEKSESRKVNSPAFRITAVVPEEYETESRLIRDNLRQFARDLKLRFDIDFISVRTFESLSFKSIKFMDGEKTAVLLTPTIFQRIGTGFINDLRRLSPQVVVHVDGEGLTGDGTSSFRQSVIEGLELYSTILESLEAANVGIGVGAGDWLRKIEICVLLPKIIAAMGAAGRHVTPWREAFGRAGLRPVGQSQFADFQAECLLRRLQVRGFHVAKQQGEMMLCWHDRPLVATSAWKC